MSNTLQSQQSGFTLIELLVVVAIIGMLSSVVLTTLSSARIRGRDAKRLADARQIQVALELYHVDNGQYPHIADSGARTGTESDECGPGDRWCTLETVLEPYIAPLPRDPLGPINATNWYYYDSDTGDGNQTYGLMVNLEYSGNSDLEADDGGIFPTLYETGEQPSFCAPANWWNTDCIN